jgi:hypothetical protein
MLTITQVDFLQRAHDKSFPKTQYIRHVAQILTPAIINRTLVDWTAVRDKAMLYGTVSSLPDAYFTAMEKPVQVRLELSDLLMVSHPVFHHM